MDDRLHSRGHLLRAIVLPNVTPDRDPARSRVNGILDHFQ